MGLAGEEPGNEASTYYKSHALNVKLQSNQRFA